MLCMLSRQAGCENKPQVCETVCAKNRETNNHRKLSLVQLLYSVSKNLIKIIGHSVPVNGINQTYHSTKSSQAPTPVHGIKKSPQSVNPNCPIMPCNFTYQTRTYLIGSHDVPRVISPPNFSFPWSAEGTKVEISTPKVNLPS